MNRRYEEEQQPYYGLEGSIEADNDGKIWLNNVNHLFSILADFLILEIRYHAFKIVGWPLEHSTVWPKIEGGDVPPSWSDWNERWSRLSAFLTIFSGRDERFAYDDRYRSGGGLEKRLLEEFNGPDYDVGSDATATLWYYPIDSNEPLDAPLNMRMLNIWVNFWDADYHGLATSALSAKIEDVVSGSPIALKNPTDEGPHGYAELWGEEACLSTRFHEILCHWVEVFAGLEALKLEETTEPFLSDLDLFIAIISIDPEQWKEGKISYHQTPPVDRWRSLAEMYDP